MNKTKIEWCDATWNPITGCGHGCPYCYARGLAERFCKGSAMVTEHRGAYIAESGAIFPMKFNPTFYPERLGEPAKLKKPSHIFTVSMGDLFGNWLPEEWIKKVLRAMEDAAQHTYTVLTKAPDNLQYWELPDNMLVGTSITGLLDTPELIRLDAVEDYAPRGRSVVSLEPYLNRLDPVNFNKRYGWLIIGGQTGRSPFKPPREWIEPLVEWARDVGVPVFVKSNAAYEGSPREYPEGVPHDTTREAEHEKT